MTLPASGTISLSAIRTEAAQSGAIAMSWVYSNTKSGQQSYALSGYYSKAWYQRNADGNCNNGNCSLSNCNCAGDAQCVNCTTLAAVNCTNCDTRAWLQSNCNCVTGYNCSQVADRLYYSACACDCACDCVQCHCDC